jgi:internalin A
MFSIRSDKWSNKRVQIHLNEYEAGLKFVIDNKCDGIDLVGSIGLEKVTVDLGLLEKVSKQLTYISIGPDIKLEQHQNVSGLYSLKKLQKLILKDQSSPIDFSEFPNLIQIGIEGYSKKFINLEKLSKLETLVITKYSEKDLTKIRGLTSLKVLHIYQSKIENLKGIEMLKRLEELSLVGNSGLNDIAHVASHTSLQKLHVEKCKKLTDFSFLKGSKNIKELFIDKLDSIGFIEKMLNLEKIHFWDSKDGDMTPLLKNKNLQIINFFPNKRHYSHTLEEIIEKTGAKQGRNK